jgi:DNA processing protein
MLGWPQPPNLRLNHDPVGTLTELQALIVLNALPNIGPITLNRVLAELGAIRARFFGAGGAAGSGEGRGAGDRGNDRDLARLRESRERRRRRWRRVAPTSSRRRTPAIRRLLRKIHDPPIGLYRKGRYEFAQPCVAIVGSRRTTLYGQAVAKKFGAELARLGFCVVSGLARGIDTAAHDGALSVGGKTAAVLGAGIDIIYPPEKPGAVPADCADGGRSCRSFPLAGARIRQSFAMRNRIVAGMCEATIVVESDVDGGAMITARFAGEQGRLIFAVPGESTRTRARAVTN